MWKETVRLEQNPHEVSLDSERDQVDPNPNLVIVSDASRSGIGHALLHRNDQDQIDRIPHSCRGRPLTTDEQNEHIFLLELRAALEGLTAWAARIPEAQFTLVVDNSATAFVLRNGFSSNVKAMGLLMEPAVLRVWERLSDVILVLSEDNPSDCCSRLKSSDSHSSWDARIGRLEHCLAARRRGWNWASRPRGEKDWKSVWALENVLRHQEGDPDDEDTILDWCPEVFSG